MLKHLRISNFKFQKVLWHFCLDINATKTAWLLEINRNTINRLFNLFRNKIYQYQIHEFKKFIGEVEIDESYFGAKRIRGIATKRKRGRGTFKQPVFGVFLRNGHVYTEIVPDCTKKTLQAIIRGRVDPQSVIYSDKWRGYDGLVDVGYDKHYRVNHGKNQFVKRKRIHINGIEAFWSFTKRRLTQFNGVKINFALHLKESEWRYKKSPKQLLKELKYILKNTNYLV